MEVLIAGAVAGSWPAAVAIVAIALSIPMSIAAFFWGLSLLG